MSLGQLIVRLSLDSSEFVTGLTKSEAQAKKFATQLDTGIARAATLAAGAMVIAGGAALLMAKNIIADAAALDDLSDATGSSVENLSKLSNQAKISGTDFGTLQGLVLKLTAGMAGADDESSNVGRALKALGVDAKDPAEALQQVAVALSKYADGTGKAAIARDLFGKGGPAFLATLKDIAELQDVAATTSTRQAAEAEKLEKAIRRLSVEGTVFKDAVLSLIVPALNNLIERFKIARTEGEGLWAALNRAGTNTAELTGTIDRQVKQVEHVRKALEAAKKSALPNFFVVQQKDLDAEEAKLRSLQSIQKQAMRSLTSSLGLDIPDNKPTLNYTGSNAKTARAAVGADDFARALESVRKMAAGAQGELDALAEGAEKLTHAQKALATLQADDVWQKFTQTQRDQLTAAYDAVSAIEKEANAVNRRREAYEKHVQAAQDMAAVETKARKRVRESVADYALQNDILSRQIALIGQDELAHQKLAAAIEYEQRHKEAVAALDLASVANLEKQYQVRLKLLEAADRANKVLEEQRKSKEFVDALGQAFASAAEDAIVFGRSAKDVLKGLEQDLLRIITRRLVTQPLEAGINSLLTGMGVGNVGAGGTGAGANWGTTLANLASSYFGGSSQGGTYGYASGTNYARGGWAMVGERGPEAMFVPRGAQVIPNHELTARREAKAVTNITVNVLPGATKQSVAQAADEQTRRQLQAARNR